jgi:hypothetical protein
MKALLSVFFFFFTLCAAAQNSETRYDTCQRLQHHQGEWQYVNGMDTIKIYLRYHRSYSPSFNSLSDNLIGWHEYKKGSAVIESNYQHRFMTLPYNYDELNTNYYSLVISLKVCSTEDFLIGTIRDITQAGELKTIVGNLNSTKTHINWKQSHMEGYGAFTGAYGMTLPKEFVLTKQ